MRQLRNLFMLFPIHYLGTESPILQEYLHEARMSGSAGSRVEGPFGNVTEERVEV